MLPRARGARIFPLRAVGLKGGLPQSGKGSNFWLPIVLRPPARVGFFRQKAPKEGLRRDGGTRGNGLAGTAGRRGRDAWSAWNGGWRGLMGPAGTGIWRGRKKPRVCLTTAGVFGFSGAQSAPRGWRWCCFRRCAGCPGDRRDDVDRPIREDVQRSQLCGGAVREQTGAGRCGGYRRRGREPGRAPGRISLQDSEPDLPTSDANPGRRHLCVFRMVFAVRFTENDEVAARQEIGARSRNGLTPAPAMGDSMRLPFAIDSARRGSQPPSTRHCALGTARASATERDYNQV